LNIDRGVIELTFFEVKAKRMS